MKINLVAAFRSPRTRKVFTGATHGDAFCNSDIKSPYDLSERDFLASEGFARPDGSHFMTRAQTNAKFGISMSEQLGEA